MSYLLPQKLTWANPDLTVIRVGEVMIPGMAI